MPSISTTTTTPQTSIVDNLLEEGYAHIQPDYYIDINDKEGLNDLKQIQLTYNKLSKDPSPGNRYRAYMKLNWSPIQQTYIKNESNDYFQSKEYNYADGGKIRKFDEINEIFLNNSLIKSLIEKDIEIAKETNMFLFDSNLEIGLHQIRYQPSKKEIGYSSPMWLHKDDEPLVFIHLLNLTSNIIGADNLIAPSPKSISNVLRLNFPFETLLVGQKVYHAVTPMGCSNDDIAFRDILLVTFQRKILEDNNEILSN